MKEKLTACSECRHLRGEPKKWLCGSGLPLYQAWDPYLGKFTRVRASCSEVNIDGHCQYFEQADFQPHYKATVVREGLTACYDCCHKDGTPGSRRCYCPEAMMPQWNPFRGTYERTAYRYCEDINVDGHCEFFRRYVP